MKKTLIALGLMALLLPAVTRAEPVTIGSSAMSDLVDSRTDTNGITTLPPGDGWDGGGNGFELSWDITPLGGVGYEYTYTISGTNDKVLSKDLSGFYLQVTNDPHDPFTLAGVADPQQYYATTDPKGDPSGARPLMPDGGIYAIKFEYDNVATATITFTSAHEPVWGNFYAKDGNDSSEGWVVAYNYNFGMNLTTGDASGFVVVPDGTLVPPSTIVPEPGLSVLGLAALVAGAVARRKTKKEAKLAA